MKNKNLILTTLCLLIGVLPLSACHQTVDGAVEDVNAGIDTFSNEVNRTNLSQDLLSSKCPQVELVADLSAFVDFVDINNPYKSNLISKVDMKRAESSCELASNNAVVDLKLVFSGKLGPKGRKKASDKPFFTYPFFVAVTAPNGKIMAKEVFAASMSFEPGQDSYTHYENLKQIIPIKGQASASRYHILVGFQLSQEQLIYNRATMVPVEKKTIAEKVEEVQVKLGTLPPKKVPKSVTNN